MDLSSGTNSRLNSVHFTDINTGYAVGEGGTVLKTVNGGASWIILSYQTTSNFLQSVYFTDDNFGYAVGEAGIILKTINGGKNLD